MFEYKIGTYIKLKTLLKNRKWYHNEMMKIIGYDESGEDYITNYNKFGLWKDIDSHISKINVYQDKECYNMERKEKLKRILK